MSEELLSEEEIKAILEESKDPRYSAKLTSFLTLKKTDIFRLSRETGLILIQGNEHTGLEHIKLRHSKISNKAYWKEGNKLENQSKFRLRLSPFEYIYVASKIFKLENKNDEKNRRPDTFDLYIGEFTHKDGVQSEYTLLTYKNTGIIHTFFNSNNRKPFNKKKRLDLRRGWSYGKQYLIKNEQIFKTPYYNFEDKEVLTVIIEYSEITEIEEWHIKIHQNQSQAEVKVKVGEKKRSRDIHFSDRISQLRFTNPEWIEKKIKELLIELNYTL